MWAKLASKEWESNDIKLLGITLDNELKFDKFVQKLTKN